MFNRRKKPPQGRPDISDLLPYDTLVSNRASQRQNIYLSRSADGDKPLSFEDNPMQTMNNPMQTMNNPQGQSFSSPGTMGEERKKVYGDDPDKVIEVEEEKKARPNRFTSIFGR